MCEDAYMQALVHALKVQQELNKCERCDSDYSKNQCIMLTTSK